MTHLKFVVKHIYKVQSCIKIGVSRMYALFETYFISLILNDSEEMTKRFLVVIQQPVRKFLTYDIKIEKIVLVYIMFTRTLMLFLKNLINKNIILTPSDKAM